MLLLVVMPGSGSVVMVMAIPAVRRTGYERGGIRLRAVMPCIIG